MTATTATAAQVRAATVSVRKVESSEDVSAITTALARGFFEDPVFEWIFPNPDRRRRAVPAMLEHFAYAYARHGETYLTEDASGAALWLPAGRQLFTGDEEVEFAGRLEAATGEDAGRLFELLELFDEHHPDGTYWTLQLMAVVPESQGQGIGSALIAPVLVRCDLEQAPAYLEATSERSVPFYERHGFRVIGEISPPDGPPLFPMWRDPR
jgi:GNAT superfamily N-acetyltransferase